MRLKEGIAASSVSLSRKKFDLMFSLRDANGILTDTLRIKNYYVSDAAKIERLELYNGSLVWDADDFADVSRSASVYGAGSEISGGTGNEHLYGLSEINDIFDTDSGGNDTLYGYSGDDVYWLGRGTGHDVIAEYYRNTGDAGDEIRIKSGITREQVDLHRSGDGKHLYVSLLDGSGLVTDSLKVSYYYTDDSAKVERLHVGGEVLDANDFMVAEIRGGTGNEHLYGLSEINDIFDTDSGGNDTLYGYSGDDVYWLGRGTGHDVIAEYYRNTGDAGDEIRIKSGITREQVDLHRSGDGKHLYVSLLDGSGLVTDSLKVSYYYTDDSAKVERLHVGGEVLDANDFMVAEIRGGTGNEHLYGLSEINDIFDTDSGGNDTLYGYSGDDVYWLGRGTGHDVIAEYYRNTGDAGDEIRIKSGITREQVDLHRSGDGKHLYVSLLDGSGLVTDSLKVSYYYTDDSAKVERLHVGGEVLDANDFMVAEIRGGTGNEHLYGLSEVNDIFDTDSGGNDTLYGYSGDDVYWLGRGTGHDVIAEYYRNTGDAGDEIRIKSGITREQVDLHRSGDGKHLYVSLLDGSGLVTDSLKVSYYYTDDSAKVERLHVGGEVLDANDFMVAEIRGGTGNEHLYGLSEINDIFDTDSGGNDTLYGYSGDDVYWLGRGTGHDVIAEYYRNTGDAGDEIRIKSGITREQVDLHRSGDGKHLYVSLLDGSGLVTDSLKVSYYYTDDSAKVERLHVGGEVLDANDFMIAKIRGGTTTRNENLYGLPDVSDVFDANSGGNDTLYGYSGDDVYWLGRGTGHDVIKEHYSNAGVGDAGDEIKVKSGITREQVDLYRSGDGKHLYVNLLNGARLVTDSLKVENYYADDSGKVERLHVGGAVLGVNDFMLAEIRGGTGNDSLFGLSGLNDVFDTDTGGNDTLYGYSGNDVYWLGRGTGHDVIKEHYSNAGVGDAGDEIKVKSGITREQVDLYRSGDGKHLYVSLLNGSGSVTDSLKVENYYADDSGKVERLHVGGAVLGVNDFMLAEIRGGTGNDSLFGLSGLNDVFDTDTGGNDTLYGYSGNDVYWLGRGTGHDVIKEHYSNAGVGDAGDEIKVKSGITREQVDLYRSGDGKHLYVSLLNGSGSVTDSLKVENYYADDSGKVERLHVGGAVLGVNDFMLAEIRGGTGNDSLFGLSGLNDVFDTDTGGNDTLYGYSGNDVYWLGRGTGHDVIKEHYSNAGVGDAGDEIRIKTRITREQVDLYRSGDGKHLHVSLLNGSGLVTDSLKVENYYADDSGKVERLYVGGAVLDVDDFMLAEIRGGTGNDSLFGLSGLNDVFDTDTGGNDTLYGYSGNDVYWLGRGTGHDVIKEHYSNAGVGDAGDEIRIKTGIDVSSVNITRRGNDLHVNILDDNGVVGDSLRIENHFSDASAKVESIHAGGKVLLESQFQLLVDAMAAFDASAPGASTESLLAGYWQDESTLAPSSA